MTTLKLGEKFEPDARHKAQRPYANGVTVYRAGGETGGGAVRGTWAERVAVKDGVIVAVYESEPGRRHAVVKGHTGEILPDYATYPWGERYVTRKALPKWIEAVKAL